MLLSVVIPTFNRVALLERTLESVWAQRFTDFEVIVVDDGSTDGTGDFVRGLGGRVQLVTQASLGAGAARNLGASQACGDYLAFLDSDDLWFPWTLACFAELIQRYDGPAILSARLMEFSNAAELAIVEESPLRAAVFADYFSSHRAGYFVGAGMSVLRRDLFMKTGGYTDRLINAEDHDLILRMGTMPGFVQILGPVTLAWRRHPSGATKDVWRTFEGVRHLFEQERLGCYPGGPLRARERRRILAYHLRPTTLHCLLHGLRREAWQLYREAFGWHVQLGRWKYLVGFPIKALLARS